MHETDIARTRNQVNKVADKAKAIVDEVEVLEQSGFDPENSQTLQAKQHALIAELAQALADFNELTNRAETVETERITYAPTNVFDFRHDADTKTLEITYAGDRELDDATVTKAGGEIQPFSYPLRKDNTVQIDTSTLKDGQRVSVSYESTRQYNSVPIGSWRQAPGNTTPPEINIDGVELPQHNLVAETRMQTESFTLGGL